MEKVEVKFEEWLEQGFALYKENIGALILPALLVLVISSLTLGILAGPMYAGLILMVLRMKDKSEPKPALGDVFQGFQFFVNSFLFALVVGLACLLGFIILSVLGSLGRLLGYLYMYSLMAFALFSLFLIVDKKMEFWPAIMTSVEKVKTNFWLFLGFTVVISVASSLGIIACGIGIIITLPFAVCATAVAYRDVFGNEASAPLVEPKTDEQKQDDQAGGTPPSPPSA